MTSLQHAKMVYANYKVHIHNQMKAENIFLGSMYMCARLGLGVYGPYTCIYTDIEACEQSGANIYIYIYIYIYICTLESWRARPNLASAAQYGYRKLWYMTLSFHIC